MNRIITVQNYSMYITGQCTQPTGKIEPPTNSRTSELFGRLSFPTARKYSRNLSNLFASKYSGSSFSIEKSNGSA